MIHRESDESQILSHLYMKSNLGMELQTCKTKSLSFFFSFLFFTFLFLFLSLIIWFSCRFSPLKLGLELRRIDKYNSCRHLNIGVDIPIRLYTPHIMTQLYTILMFTKYHFFRCCVPTSSTPSNLILVLLSNKKRMLLVWTSSSCLPWWTIFKNHYIHLIPTVLSYTLRIRFNPFSLRQLFAAVGCDSQHRRFSLFFSLL